MTIGQGLLLTARLLLASADPSAGKALFEGQGACATCHTVGNRGGTLGPDLSDIGVLRTPEELRLAVTDPDAEVRREYTTITAVTDRGQRIQGIRLNEDDYSIQLRDIGGNPRSLLKDNLKSLSREPRSLMPSYASRFSAPQIDHLIAYLRSLRGAAPRSGVPHTRNIAPVSERLDWLTRPGRDGDELPEMVMDALPLPQAAAVADVGAGAGYFTWRLARRVGAQGKVIAVEIQRAMLDLIASELNQRDIHNVELVLGAEHDPRLPPAALDLVLVANAYHEFSRPEQMMAAIRRSLKPGGRLVVLEYRKEGAYTYLEELHKMSLDELRSEMEAFGFQTEQVLEFLPRQHLVIFSGRQP
jgi:putative heme-binding domain-containing protein